MSSGDIHVVIGDLVTELEADYMRGSIAWIADLHGAPADLEPLDMFEMERDAVLTVPAAVGVEFR